MATVPEWPMVAVEPFNPSRAQVYTCGPWMLVHGTYAAAILPMVTDAPEVNGARAAFVGQMVAAMKAGLGREVSRREALAWLATQPYQAVNLCGVPVVVSNARCVLGALLKDRVRCAPFLARGVHPDTGAHIDTVALLVSWVGEGGPCAVALMSADVTCQAPAWPARKP